MIGERAVEGARRDERLQATAARVGKHEGGGRIKAAVDAALNLCVDHRVVGGKRQELDRPVEELAEVVGDRADQRHRGGGAPPGKRCEAKRLRLRLTRGRYRELGAGLVGRNAGRRFFRCRLARLRR